ncbi:hypothetical protein F2Q69_00022754 [Brassica cretica]|uniref:Uncharacterized protein n=1 Tax=Brassica cretica TaxID=69181 RepID=A0A8S9Q9R5_BRACR|nr:hypothetical protein F2Q69_00022754 [Brassica cretica]
MGEPRFNCSECPDLHAELVPCTEAHQNLGSRSDLDPDRTEARVWNISGERQLADDLTRTQSTRPISPTPLAQIREEVIELRGMVSTSIDKSRNKETAYRTIANRRDQAERELTKHQASAQERNQPPTSPSGVTPNPLNLGAFSTPEFLSARSRRYIGENSQRTPQQGMAYRSLSYSGLDEIPGYKAHEVRRSNHKTATKGQHSYAINNSPQKKSSTYDLNKFCPFHNRKGRLTEEYRAALRSLNENKETGEDNEEEEAPPTPKTNRKIKGSSNKTNRKTELESPSSPPPEPKKRVDMISWVPKRDIPNKIEGQTEGKVCIDITVAIRTLEDLDRASPP